MKQLVVKNPYSGTELETLSFASTDEVRSALDRSVAAFQTWRNSSSHERARVLSDVAARLLKRQDEFARLIQDEAGKPIRYARIEVERCLGVLQWAAAETQRFSGELLRIDTSSGGRPGFGIAGRFPRGPILGITPFNFPLNLTAHKVAPAVAAGCSILIKPSPATPLTAIRFAELFAEAGAPKGLVQVILADDDATAALTRAPEIKMVSFTGSARVGKLIRAQAIDKPVTLELGGNAWVIVMDDVPQSDLPAIAKRITGGAFGYAGQSCISVQNVVAPMSLIGALEKALVEVTENIAFGDPSNPDVISGPVINLAAAQRIQKELGNTPIGAEQIQSRKAVSVGKGGLVVPPTLVTLANVQSYSSSLVQEEIFGPVMTLGTYKALDQMIAVMNNGHYGLQAGVFTQRWPTIEKLYRELNVGGLVVNDVPTTRYDHQPYGGVKDSGQGREGVRYAMDEMTEPKFLALSSVIPT
jgi:aldehyde dehydrogenase (NAD+)/glyceraldehyde-3-phosphate dehydrogenase (NADP+)